MYFGRIARPSGSIPRVNAVEPERTQVKRFERFAPKVQFPAAAMTYLGPPSKSSDIAALTVAEAILSGGESTRLYLDLVRPGIAQESDFYIDLRVDRSLLVYYSIAAEGKAPAEMESAMLRVIARMQRTPVGAKELRKAKNGLIAEALRARQTNDGKAIAIERSVAYLGDPKLVNSDIERLEAVTAADVLRVMKKYFAPNKRVVLFYMNQEGKSDAK